MGMLIKKGTVVGGRRPNNIVQSDISTRRRCQLAHFLSSASVV
jgi:hypothetical protein